MVCKKEDPTKTSVVSGIPPGLGPSSQNVGSLCLCGVWGRYSELPSKRGLG